MRFQWSVLAFFFRGSPRWPVIIAAAGQATLHSSLRRNPIPFVAFFGVVEDYRFGTETGRRSAHFENNIPELDDFRNFVDSGDELRTHSADPVGFASTRPGMRSVEG